MKYKKTKRTWPGTVHKNPQKVETWLLSAAAHTKTAAQLHPVFSNIFRDDNGVFAADGYRIHYSPEVESFEPGLNPSKYTPSNTNGRFPDVQTIIDMYREFQSYLEFIVCVGDFMQALCVVEVFGKDSADNVQLNFELDTNEPVLYVRSHSKKRGESVVSVQIEHYLNEITHPLKSYQFDMTYLRDALKGFAADSQVYCRIVQRIRWNFSNIKELHDEVIFIGDLQQKSRLAAIIGRVNHEEVEKDAYIYDEKISQLRNAMSVYLPDLDSCVVAAFAAEWFYEQSQVWYQQFQQNQIDFYQYHRALEIFGYLEAQLRHKYIESNDWAAIWNLMHNGKV